MKKTVILSAGVLAWLLVLVAALLFMIDGTSLHRDPSPWRVGFAVLAFYGGLAAVLALAARLDMTEAVEPEMEALDETV